MSPAFMMLSRELKMIQLNFSWPLSKIWKGYLRSCGNDECEGCSGCSAIEPPEGTGYQLWETVSEGSPVSPVFETKEKLCKWLSSTPRDNDITNHFSYEDWLKIIEDGCPVMDIHTRKYVEKP